MSTITKSNAVVTSVRSEAADSISEFWQQAEKNRFGITPMILVVIACVGGGAASFGALSDVFQLALLSATTTLALSMILAVAPMRTIVIASAIALLADLLVFII